MQSTESYPTKTQGKKAVMLVLTDEMDAELDAAARRWGESRSNLVRTAIRAFLKQDAKEAA